VGRQRLAHVGLAVGLAVGLLGVGVVALPGVKADEAGVSVGFDVGLAIVAIVDVVDVVDLTAVEL
jgi:hypothetical protein